MTATQQPTLNGLAAKVTELSQSFTKSLEDLNVAQPTFAVDSPLSYSNLTPELFKLRQELIDTLNDMAILAQGPTESVMNYAHNCVPDVAALNILNYFNFWSAVPLDGSATYDEIAQKVSLPRAAVQRVLEHALTLRLFEQAEPGASPARIVHNSRSAALAQSSGLRALVTTLLDDAGPPMLVMNEALDRYSRGKTELPQDMSESPFALFHSGGTFGGKFTNSWELLENHGEGDKKGWRQTNFVEFMKYVKDIFQLDGILENAFDWKSLGNVSVVDIGGSGGHDDFILAQKFPNLDITVQDLPKVEPSFNANLPTDLAGRVKFLAHNFFEPQPLQADIYIIKMIFHDWPDQECIKILKALIPALKVGTRILFIDYVGKHLDSSGEVLPRSIQQMGTSTDLRMMALFNTEERPVEAWKRIFETADKRFDVVRVESNPLTFMVVLEVVWRG